MSPLYANLITDEHETESVKLQSLWADGEMLSWVGEAQSEAMLLKTLTFKVSARPKDLLAHLRRIHFCYQQQLAEPLYAALLDFLWVLDGQGRALSQRLILGCRSRLEPLEFEALKNAHGQLRSLAGNQHSVFTRGLSGTTHLLEPLQTAQAQHDYLALAHDFIEFSQLDEAMAVLESGLASHPERQDLQLALLELYRSTASHDRALKQYQSLRASGAPLIDEWQAQQGLT